MQSSIVVRIKEILDQYPEGSTVIKELLQNSDDAGCIQGNLMLIDVNNWWLILGFICRSYGVCFVSGQEKSRHRKFSVCSPLSHFNKDILFN